MVRIIFLSVMLAASAFGQALVLEDFSCWKITAVTSVAGGKTNLTCISPHGIPVSTTYHLWIQGGTGAWAAINNQNEGMVNGLYVGPTDTTIMVNDTRWVETPAYAWFNNEKVWIASKDAGHIYLGAHTGCNSNGRGCDGTTIPAYYEPQHFNSTTNINRSQIWDATAIDANTLQINLDSSGLGSFSGQNVYMRRALYSVDQASGNVRAYTGQPWAIYDAVTADGLAVTIPKCADLSDAIECSRGFLTPYNNKGYVYGPVGISSFTVSGGVATIMFTANWTDTGTNGTLRSAASSTNGQGALVWVDGMNESVAGIGKLNRPYLVTDVITSGSNKTGVHVPITGVADGTYTGTGSFTVAWPMDGYTDSNWTVGSADQYPASTARSFLKYGATWDSSYNRIRFWVKYDGVNRTLAESNGINFGTYVFHGSDPGDKNHGYHGAAFPIVDGRWVQVEINQRPQGLVGAGSAPDLSDDPLINAGRSAPYMDNPAWKGGARHYFDALERWYMDPSSSNASTKPLVGSTETFKRFEFDKALNEPEEWVCGKSILYSGTKYQITINGPKQNCGYCGLVPVTYNFYYSTSGSMKVSGISSGTSAGSADLDTSLTSQIAGYDSPAMAQANTIWWAIRPKMAVFKTSGSGQSPIWVWSWDDYGMSTGDHVTVAGVAGNTAANQTNVALTDYRPKQVWTRFVPTSGTWSTPNTITSVVSDGSTCTANLTVSHGLVAGWPLYIPDGMPSGGPLTNQNPYTVASVPTSTSFTFACAGTTPGTYNTDYDSTHHMAIMAVPGIAIAGTGNGAWTGTTQGTVISTEDTKNFSEIAFTEPTTVGGGGGGGGSPMPAVGTTLKGGTYRGVVIR